MAFPQESEPRNPLQKRKQAIGLFFFFPVPQGARKGSKQKRQRRFCAASNAAMENAKPSKRRRRQSTIKAEGVSKRRQTIVGTGVFDGPRAPFFFQKTKRMNNAALRSENGPSGTPVPTINTKQKALREQCFSF